MIKLFKKLFGRKEKIFTTNNATTSFTRSSDDTNFLTSMFIASTILDNDSSHQESVRQDFYSDFGGGSFGGGGASGSWEDSGSSSYDSNSSYDSGSSSSDW